MNAMLLLLALPTVTVRGTGDVEGVVTLPIPVETLRAKLVDPQFLPRVSGDGTTVTVAGREGDCLILDSVSPSSVVEVRYRVRRCPTATGFHIALVSSPSFDAYSTEIRLSPAGAGTELRYHLRVDPSFPVPAFVINSGTRDGIDRLLRGLEAWVAAHPAG